MIKGIISVILMLCSINIDTRNRNLIDYLKVNKDNVSTTFQVILRRQDGSVEFTREWEDFKQGFGYLTGEFYAGQSFH